MGNTMLLCVLLGFALIGLNMGCTKVAVDRDQPTKPASQEEEPSDFYVEEPVAVSLAASSSSVGVSRN